MSAECSLHNATQYFAYFVFNKNNLMTITWRDKQKKITCKKSYHTNRKRQLFTDPNT